MKSTAHPDRGDRTGSIAAGIAMALCALGITGVLGKGCLEITKSVRQNQVETVRTDTSKILKKSE